MLDSSAQDLAGLRPSTEGAMVLLDLGLNVANSADAERGMEGPLERAGDLIGRYRLTRPLGTGGFGNVWLAEQTEPMRRQVALKLIKPGMDSREIIARFEAERQALALMDHTNIARVLDAGTSAAGRPYFVLEWVQGIPLTTYCDQHALSLAERLALFVQVCEAVQHAHQKAIIHRDLKPSNILVAEHGGKPMPKVIDFGIAKALANTSEQALRSMSLQTQVGVAIGTPNYMSPEQAGIAGDVDTRSDIYGLGVVLYELLVGATPLGLDGSRPLSDEILRAIREQEPIRPSMRFAKAPLPRQEQLAKARSADPVRLLRALRGDLDWITIKALEKDRQRRYATALAFAADVNAYLDRRPVTAAAPTWTYRFGKFARRNAPALVTTSLFGATLLGATAVSLWHASRAEQSRVEAEQHRLEAEKNFSRATQAVEFFLSRITDQGRLHEPDLQDFTLGLMNSAIGFYEEISARAGNDPKVRLDHASALGRLGSLYHRIGNAAKAESAWLRAMEIDKRLMAEFPPERQYRREHWIRVHNMAFSLARSGNTERAEEFARRALELGEEVSPGEADPDAHRNKMVHCWENFAQVLAQRGKNAEAEQAYEQAFQMQKALVDADPRNLERRDRLAQLRTSQATRLSDRGTAEAAIRLYEEGDRLNQKLLAEAPDDPRFQERSVVISNNAGLLRWKGGQKAQGEAMMLQAAEAYQRLAEKFPSRTGYRQSAADCLTNLAGLLREDKRPGDAFALLSKAAEIQENLALEFPGNQRMQDVLIRALQQLALDRKETGRWAEARDLLHRAIVFYQRSHSSADRDADRRLMGFYEELADACLRAGDVAGALAAHIKLAQSSPKGWEPWARAAREAARCHHWLVMNPLSAGETRAQGLERCKSAMLEALERAVHHGYIGVEFFPENEAVPGIAAHARFQALVKVRRPGGPSDEQLAAIWSRGFHSFTFDYRGADPGKRVWERKGNIWTETQPSGTRNVYAIAGMLKFGPMEGTELRKINGGDTRLFVPFRDTAGPKKLFMKGPKEWGILGDIGDMK